MTSFISVHKDTVNKKPVDAALLAVGTASHVWFEDEVKSEKKETHAFRQAALRKAARRSQHMDA